MVSQARIAGFTAESNGRYTTRKPLTPAQIMKAAKTLAKRQIKKKDTIIDCPEASKLAFQGLLEDEEREVFAVLFLTTKQTPISLEQMFYGTIDEGSVYPREVVKRALHVNAAALIVAHNHPSGNPKPSRSDIDITGSLKEALNLVDIRLIDHLIIGKPEVISLAEKGLM